MSSAKWVDVLVIGAGLAGCSLGLLMCRAGKSVLAAELFDARSKDKLCGGVLSGNAPELFGCIYGKDALEHLGAVKLDGVENVLMEKHLNSPFTALALPRKRLDDFCLNAYLAAGGELVDCMSLRAIDEREHVARFLDFRTREMRDVRYDVLVGADGACSKVRRLLTGRIGTACISAEGRVALREEHIVATFQAGFDGLYWYIPNGDDANVGCLFHGLSAGECREKLQDFCAVEGYCPSLLRCAPIPTGEDVLLKAGEDIWLVGDAAGLASKTGGSGMHHAIRSALMLSESLRGGKGYEDAMASSLQDLARIAEKADMYYFKTVMCIALSGSIRGS